MSILKKLLRGPKSPPTSTEASRASALALLIVFFCAGCATSRREIEGFKAAADLQFASMTEAKAMAVLKKFYSTSYRDDYFGATSTTQPLRIDKNEIVLLETGPTILSSTREVPWSTTRRITWQYDSHETKLNPANLELEAGSFNDTWTMYEYVLTQQEPHIWLAIFKPDFADGPAIVAAHRFLYPQMKLVYKQGIRLDKGKWEIGATGK
jgi:hypothetical protein